MWMLNKGKKDRNLFIKRAQIMSAHFNLNSKLNNQN